MELTAALCVILLLVMVAIGYHQTRCEVRTARDELESLRSEVTRMGRRVDTATQANTGARIMAQNALARAERAEVVASKPIVLVRTSANDGVEHDDKIKKH